MTTATEDRIGDLRYSVSPTWAGRDPAEVQALHAESFAKVSEILATAGLSPKVSLTAKDTQWGDESYYQDLIDLTRYPYWVNVHRSNDGTFDDPQWPAAYAKLRSALDGFGTVEHPNPRGLALAGVYF